MMKRRKGHISALASTIAIAMMNFLSSRAKFSMTALQERAHKAVFVRGYHIWRDERSSDDMMRGHRFKKIRYSAYKITRFFVKM
ncbi:hypothetical protein CDAR_479971 [Caerostris darwini]|uniref:Secreted protein n=1 Tax=Caerostris darwini TaxID=1538125 RepID=A0AAV4T215_9ARAC|nr:hypothetical protein CDAR_479971 [Caerostris darwini]